MSSPIDLVAMVLVNANPTVVQPPVVTVNPPTSPTTARRGGIPGFVEVGWTNGDATAFTRIYVDVDSSFAPYAVVNPGATTWGSDIAADQPYTFYLTHARDGLESVQVAATWAGY